MNTNPSLLAVSRTVGVPVTAEAPELPWKREVLSAGAARAGRFTWPAPLSVLVTCVMILWLMLKKFLGGFFGL